MRIVIASPPTAACSAAGVSSAASSPLVHDGDAVGPLGFVQQMRREHDRDAVALADLLQVLPQVAAGAGVEAGGRLVEQQQPRAMQHALGQLDAAPQAAGERFDQVAAAIGEAQAGEHFVGPRAELAAAEAVEPAVVDEVFDRR